MSETQLDLASESPTPDAERPMTNERLKTKTEFVLAHPDTPAAELAELGTKSGYSLTPQHVHVIRSIERKKQQGSKAKWGRTVKPTTEFIRTLPFDMQPAEVIARAKAAGLEVNNKDIWSTRNLDKKAGRKKLYPKEPGAAPVVKSAKPAAKQGATRVAGSSVATPQTDAEKRFVESIAEIGIPRAAALVEGMHAGWVQYVQSLTRG